MGYLEEGTHIFTLKNGAVLKVYASPYSPEIIKQSAEQNEASDWAFSYTRDEDRFNDAHLVANGKKSIA